MVLVSNYLFEEAYKLLHILLQTMLDTLIQSKTRLKILLRFFLNPDSSAYLRGLAQEFDESSNAVRVELNRFEVAGLIQSHKAGNKKIDQGNTNYPMFNELQKIAFKHFGIDQIIEQVIGYDIDKKKMENLKKGFPYVKHLGAKMMETLAYSYKADATTDFSSR